MNEQEHDKYFLQHVRIEKMWGTHNIDTKIEHINLFVGFNGTGKTTFINIVEAVASCDVQNILRLRFDKCNLLFSNNTEIICSRFVDSNDDDIVEYSIIIDGNAAIKKFKFDAARIAMRNRRIRFNGERYEPRLEKIKSILSRIVNISWVSVERKQPILNKYESTDELYRIGVDGKIDELIDDIQKYKSNVESEEKDLLDNFRKKVFELMLYDKNIDSMPDATKPTSERWSTQLKRAFHDLGLTTLDEKINSHVKAVNEGFKTLTRQQGDVQKQIEAIAIVTLYKRTMQIVTLSKELEVERKKVREHFEIYLDKLNFFIDKKINGIHEKCLDDDMVIDASLLSSGEKQIVILLSEMLLHGNENIIFIADEPELSLHIGWQREIVGAIHDLNKNAQLIFATHSPEVVSKWSQYVINMKTISSSI